MKNKVLKLDTAKKLQKVVEEKGVELPESELSWFIANGENHQKTELRKSNSGKFGLYEEYPGYTVGELLEILGDKFLTLELTNHGEQIKWSASTKTHLCDCEDCDADIENGEVENSDGSLAFNWESVREAETPQEALSRLLIKLIQEDIYETRQ